MSLDPQQPVELERVSARIGATIVAWCAERLFAGDHEFHLEDVVEHVRARLGGAPDSVSRILRSLRSKGTIAYVVMRRHESLYRLVRVGALEAA
ncbi:MAG: hypothetical protein NVS3B10_00360 [Polyangiales bacterium]